MSILEVMCRPPMAFHSYSGHITVSRIAKDIGTNRKGLLRLAKVNGITLIRRSRVRFVRSSDAERLKEACEQHRERRRLATPPFPECPLRPRSQRPPEPVPGGAPNTATALLEIGFHTSRGNASLPAALAPPHDPRGAGLGAGPGIHAFPQILG